MNNQKYHQHLTGGKLDLQREIEAIRIFEAALALPTDERERWLADQIFDPGMTARVLALVKAAADSGTFLETPAALPIRGSAGWNQRR